MEQIRQMRENFDVALRQKYYNEETTAKTRDRENIANLFGESVSCESVFDADSLL